MNFNSWVVTSVTQTGKRGTQPKTIHVKVDNTDIWPHWEEPSPRPIKSPCMLEKLGIPFTFVNSCNCWEICQCKFVPQKMGFLFMEIYYSRLYD